MFFIIKKNVWSYLNKFSGLTLTWPSQEKFTTCSSGIEKKKERKTHTHTHGDMVTSRNLNHTQSYPFVKEFKYYRPIRHVS